MRIGLTVIATITFFQQVVGQVATVDYAVVAGLSHPETFGVVIKSPQSEVQSFDLLVDHGVKMIRATAPLNVLLPAEITMEDYKANVDNVQNPDTWPGWNRLDGGHSDYSWAIHEAKSRGLKTLLSISYLPQWLSWGEGGPKPFHRVPKDWEIYQEIYKTVYQRFRNDVDMVGISNEPNFMGIDGSPYLSKYAAYKDMFRYAAAAIREVDKDVEILGPEVAYQWKGRNGVRPHPENMAFVRELVETEGVPGHLLNGITYHHYFDGVDVDIVRNLTTLPVYVTEWNASSGVGHNTPPNMSGLESLIWVGDNLIRLLRQGVNGSCMYTHYERPIDSDLFGTYAWDRDRSKAIPHLNMRAFRLLSKSLGLGEGKAQVAEVSGDGKMNLLAATNSQKEHILAFTNQSLGNNEVELVVRGLIGAKNVDIVYYEASAQNDATTPTRRERLAVNDDTITLKMTVSGKAIQGIKIKPIKHML